MEEGTDVEMEEVDSADTSKLHGSTRKTALTIAKTYLSPFWRHRLSRVGCCVILAIGFILLCLLLVNSIGSTPGTKRVIPPGASVTESVLRPETDKRLYRTVNLANGLRALVVSDPKAATASAAMDINVGSHFDPRSAPGLAHFLEHMLFMGSREFPDESEYFSYLQLHGGYSNAYTASENTNYFFAVRADSLYASLQRFAPFFAHPLLKADQVRREMHAVNAEHGKNLQNDDWRQWQLLKELSDSASCFHNFGTGNLDTLNRSDIREVLLEFYNHYYSDAANMKLVILGTEPLDTLQRWVEELFSLLPGNGTVQKAPRPNASAAPFPQSLTGRRVFMAAVGDLRQLNFIWSLRETLTLYRNQPTAYFKYILTGQAAGSLSAELGKRKGWIESVNAEVLEDTPDFTLVTLTLHMTTQGVEFLEELTAAVFKYLALLQQTDGDRHCAAWQEMVQLQELNFRFQDPLSPEDFTEKTASRMRWMHTEDLLGATAHFHCEASVLTEMFDKLTPENVLQVIVLTGSAIASETIPLVEPVYSTRYNASQLPQTWKTVDANVANFVFPPGNPYLPRSLTPVPLPASVDKHPSIVAGNKSSLAVWHGRSSLFAKEPKIDFRCVLESAELREDVMAFILAELHTAWVEDCLEEETAFSALAGLRFSYDATMSGAEVHIAGYSDKLPDLLERFLARLADSSKPPDNVRFGLIRQRLLDEVANERLRAPYLNMARYYRNELLLRPFYTWDTRASALSAATPGLVSQFARRFLGMARVECLAFGSLEAPSSLQLASRLRQTLDLFSVEGATVVAKPIPGQDVILPVSGTHLNVQVRAANAGESNSAICSVFQIAAADEQLLDLPVALDVIGLLIETRCFDQLRTKEQLGYVVWCTVRHHYSAQEPNGIVTTLNVIVQSSTYNASFLNERTLAFLQGYTAELQNLSSNAFTEAVTSLVQEWTRPPLNIGEEVEAYWAEIKQHLYNFDRRALRAKRVQRLGIGQIQEAFTHVTGQNRRQLTVLYSPASAQDQPGQRGATVLKEAEFLAWKETQPVFVA
eukprot:TRINITY_DN13391_c0_g1_i1.p1 TRINITY_DN13391_c0_g1~~TRINITY_DN13391_c0_g1_i1.p1  ORF type:complete len:1044 (+),score=164.71 TRINITY_DN13391_c0_g1_i1:1463-4594(+)